MREFNFLKIGDVVIKAVIGSGAVYSEFKKLSAVE
jgi:hypothetical protein